MDLMNVHIPTMHITDEDIVEAFRISYDLVKAEKMGDRGKWERKGIVNFDNKVEGVLGEIAIKNFLTEAGLEALYGRVVIPNEFGNRDLEVRVPISGIRRRSVLEVKTSYLPDRDKSLNDFLQHEDIKIYAYDDNPRNDLLKKDVYIQLLVFINIAEKNSQLFSISDSVPEPGTYMYDQYIEFYRQNHKDNMYFAGWTTAEHELETLQQYSGIEDMKWFQRDVAYWKSKFSDAYAPDELISMLMGPSNLLNKTHKKAADSS